MYLYSKLVDISIVERNKIQNFIIFYFQNIFNKYL